MSDVLTDAIEELARADKKHPPMAGMVEGLHTLKCEVAEFEREVMREMRDHAAMRRELVQVVAMCRKFERDILDQIGPICLSYDRDELPAQCPICDVDLLGQGLTFRAECGECGRVYRVVVSP